MKFFRDCYSNSDWIPSADAIKTNKIDAFTNNLINFGFLNTDGSKSFAERAKDGRPAIYNFWALKWYKDPLYLSKTPDNTSERNAITIFTPDNIGNPNQNTLFTCTPGVSKNFAPGASTRNYFTPFWFIPVKGGGFIISRFNYTYGSLDSQHNSSLGVDTAKYSSTPPFLTPYTFLQDPHCVFPNESDARVSVGPGDIGIYTIIGVPDHFNNDMLYFFTQAWAGTSLTDSKYVGIYDGMHVNQTNNMGDHSIDIPYIDRAKDLVYDHNQADFWGKGSWQAFAEWYNAKLNKPYDTVDVNQNVCTLIRMPYRNTFYDNIYLISTAPNDKLLEGQFFSFNGRNFLCVYQNLVVELPNN